MDVSHDLTGPCKRTGPHPAESCLRFQGTRVEPKVTPFGHEFDRVLRTPYEMERERNQDAERLVTLSVQTRVPSKWRFVDLETGDVWGADHEGRLRKATLPNTPVVRALFE